ncbi:hypothetical protein B296_00007360 [Ensete ventricosum]|uniref:Uncharacterized protein n=1 Tax=Ensete ventricosum TaxID=4639 RepID=A0A426ZIK0_ENSVE|nr:hypothetical protein B296_00007360 [Ensete ventricosum]
MNRPGLNTRKLIRPSKGSGNELVRFEYPDLAEKVNSDTNLGDLTERANSGTNLEDLAERANPGTNLGDLAERANSGVNLRDLAERTNPGTNFGDLTERANVGTNLGDLAEWANSGINLGDLTKRVNSSTNLRDLVERANCAGHDLDTAVTEVWTLLGPDGSRRSAWNAEGVGGKNSRSMFSRTNSRGRRGSIDQSYEVFVKEVVRRAGASYRCLVSQSHE